MKKQTALGTKLYSARYSLGLIGVVALALYFRFYHLGSLPPGLSNGESVTATTALNIIHKTISSSQLLDAGISQAVYGFIVAISVKLLGATSFALRLPSALLGLATVIMTFFWIKAWFGEKVALIAAFLVAITPWTVGLSRIAVPSSGTAVIIPTLLFLITQSIRKKSVPWAIATGFLLAIISGSVTGLYILAGLILAGMPFQFIRSKQNRTHKKAFLTIVGITLLIGLPLAVVHFRQVKIHIPTLNSSSIEAAVSRASLTLGMFNVRGDNDFQYNISGTPELNLFVGLMFLVGILTCLIQIKKLPYRALLILMSVLLIPVVIQANAPNSLTALILAPIALSLAAIGVNYMLQVWYSTFPINSAARTLGTVPIVLLLAISAYQGYKQYFIAWAHSPETYIAYNERATSLSGYLNRTKFSGQRYVIATGQDNDIINFLTYSKSTYTAIPASQISNLAQSGQPIQIIFTTPLSNDIIPDLKKRFPKAQLSQHFSEFNDNNQLFAVYQTKP
jgi:4-amino-4-deoxy-L-arabinose transferase-like glycosyltransferase